MQPKLTWESPVSPSWGVGRISHDLPGGFGLRPNDGLVFGISEPSTVGFDCMSLDYCVYLFLKEKASKLCFLIVIYVIWNISSQELMVKMWVLLGHICFCWPNPDQHFTNDKGRHLHRHLGFFEPVDFVRFTRGALVALEWDGQDVWKDYEKLRESSPPWNQHFRTRKWMVGRLSRFLLGITYFQVLLLMEEILHHLGCIKPRE